MTGLYRINHGNTVFRGKPGTMFRTQDGPLLRAALLAGAVSRVDVEPAVDTPNIPDAEPTEQGSDLQKQPESVEEALPGDAGTADDQEPVPADATPRKKKS